MFSRSFYMLAGVLALFLFTSPARPETSRLSVEELVKEAVMNNPEITAAQMRLEAFRAKVPQASALQDPMLGLGVVNLPTNFSFRD